MEWNDNCMWYMLIYRYIFTRYIYLSIHIGRTQWKPGSPWDSNWKLSVNIYISAATDVVDIAELFMEVSLCNKRN